MKVKLGNTVCAFYNTGPVPAWPVRSISITNATATIKNKNGAVDVTQTNVFIDLFTTCFGPGRPSSGHS
jgi:hypothetical protein